MMVSTYVTLFHTFLLLISAVASQSCPPSCTCDEDAVRCLDGGLEEIPDSLSKNVEKLIIFDSDISVLTDSVFTDRNLMNLEVVKLPNDSIEEVEPGAFYGLSSLTEVDLSSNHFSLLHPDLFKDNTGLSLLNLKGNRNLTLSPTGPFLRSDSLREIVLADCELSTVPSQALLHLPSLEYIDLSGNKLTEVLPGTFSSLESLEEMDLSRNFIKQLTHGIFNQNPRLAKLHLGDNELTDLPKDIFPNLEYLDVSNCKLQGINSDSFKNMERLVYLNLSGNWEMSIEDTTFSILKDLAYVDLSNNTLVELSSTTFESNSELEVLNLNNSLAGALFPHGGLHGDFQKMYKLDISGNGIGYLENCSFCFTYKLAILNVSHNVMSEISDEIFSPLESLIALDISYNFITNIDGNAFRNKKNLRHLYLSNNLLTSIVVSELLSATPSLQTLDLSYCELEIVKPGDGVAFPKLASLNLAGNRLLTLDIQVLKMLPGLAGIGLRENAWLCDFYFHNLIEWISSKGIVPVQSSELPIHEQPMDTTWAEFEKDTCSEILVDNEDLNQFVLSVQESTESPPRSFGTGTRKCLIIVSSFAVVVLVMGLAVISVVYLRKKAIKTINSRLNYRPLSHPGYSEPTTPAISDRYHFSDIYATTVIENSK